MTFNFHHLKVDYPNGDKWTKADFDFMKLKEIIQNGKLKCKRAEDGMHCFGVTMINLDCFRFGNDEKYHNESA